MQYRIGDNSLNVQCGVRRIGFGISHYDDDIETYSQFYINSLPTLFALAIVYGSILAIPEFASLLLWKLVAQS